MDTPIDPVELAALTVNAGAPPRRPTPGRGKLIVRLVIMTLLLALVSGGLYGFDQFRKTMMAKYFATNVPPPAAVATAVATAEAIPRFLEGIGTLAAVHQVTVAPEVGGRITAILFEAGAAVAAGAPLVQINDSPDRADLASFKAQERLALLTLERSRTLAVKNFGTQQSVDQSQSQLDVARAGIARVEAVIAEKLIRAPFAGQLGIRMAEVGQIVGTGAPMVTLSNLDQLYANFALPEQARDSLRLNQPVELLTDAFPGRVFPATVTVIEPQVDAGTRSIKAQATLSNPDHLLLPGMFAAVRVKLAPQIDAVTVPETALDVTPYGESVYLVHEEGTTSDGKPVFKATQSFVKTGVRHDGRVVILEGVAAGDRVVSAGQIKLHNGSTVTPQEAGPLTKPSVPPMN